MTGRTAILAILLVLLALPAAAGAASPSAFPDTGLAVVAAPSNFTLDQSPASRTLSIQVTNPTAYAMDVYLTVYNDGEWDIIEKLGNVSAGARGSFQYPVNFTYGGKTEEVDRFGVVGRTSAGYSGAVFSITEDWTSYEDALKASLSFFGVISAAVLLAVLAVAMAGALAVAMRSRRDSDGEYTLRTLFFPVLRMRPWAERIADILINPFFWAVEMGLGAVLVALILWFAVHDTRADIGWLIFIVGGVAAIFMPVIFLLAAWLADYYEREPFRFIAGLFMWGVMATFFAFFINTTASLVAGLVLGAGAADILVAVIVAPIVEETAKGAGLLVLSGHHEFDNVFDGIVFGFAIGMGFAFIENWLYFATNASPVVVGGLGAWACNILYRSFLCSLAHGCFTAATGAVIGYVKGRAGPGGFAIAGFVVGLPVAIILHGTFNLTAVLDSIMQTAFGVPVPVFDPILTVVITGIYIMLGAYLQLKMKNKATIR